ncbi:MAG: HDOD domain-containing protein, partial [Planctomycetota bacterium]
STAAPIDAGPADAGSSLEVTQGPPPRMITAELEKLFHKISDIASFPAIARKIINVASNDDASVEDLLEVVEQDPVLSLKILQTVNSAYYGLPNEVADLRTGVTLLGMKQVRNMALTVIVGRHYAMPSAVGYIDPTKMWDHSVCVAAAARVVAQKTGAADPDEAYLAGLIHDAGLLVIDQQFEKELPRVLAHYKTNRCWMQAEQEVLSFDHAQLGAYIAWRSGFPHRLVAAVDYHHCPTEASDDVAPLSAVVSVANYLVSRLGRMAMQDRRLSPPLEVVFERLQLDRRQVRTLWGELEAVLDTVGELKQL